MNGFLKHGEIAQNYYSSYLLFGIYPHTPREADMKKKQYLTM